jgi:hypothetical protein
MSLGVIVGSENDMNLGRALVEVGWSRGSRASTVVAHREGKWTQKVEVTIVKDGVEPLLSRNTSRRIGRGE